MIEENINKKLKVCIEFFPELMTEKEKKSTSIQINQCINELKNSQKSVNLILSNYKSLSDYFSKGFDNWPVTFQDESIFSNQNKLIILSADADEELTELDLNYTYVIGGLVDKNRYKNLLKNKGSDYKTQKFCISKYLKLTTNVLSINQSFGILVDFFNTEDWKLSFGSIPKRKILNKQEDSNFK